MDKRKDDALLAILVALLIVGVAVALVYFEILPAAALAITALYLALVAGLALLVLWLRPHPRPARSLPCRPRS